MVQQDDKCEVFGKAHDEKAEECQQCKVDYPEEYEECKKLTKKAIEEKSNEDSASEKSEKTKSSPEEKEPKQPKERKKALSVNVKKLCRDLLNEGKTKEEILAHISGLYKEAGKDDKYAQSRARAIYNDISKEAKGSETTNEPTDNNNTK